MLLPQAGGEKTSPRIGNSEKRYGCSVRIKPYAIIFARVFTGPH